MAGAKNHDYHILPPSITPILGSFSALTMFFGLVMWMHPEQFSYGSLIFGLGLIAVIYTFYAWWSDVVHEAQSGDHTPVVQLAPALRHDHVHCLRSHVLRGWFWAWFDYSLFPVPLELVKDAETHAFTVTNLIGQEGAAALMQWPPKGLEVLDSMKLPLLNTLILLCSGTTVTWAHHALIHGDREGLKKGLWLTILLGLLFSSIQAYEYAEAPFPFAGLNYGTAFYMATGFHGFHVIVGTIFLAVCLATYLQGPFHASAAFRV